jgi:hypothetical protein
MRGRSCCYCCACKGDVADSIILCSASRCSSVQNTRIGWVQPELCPKKVDALGRPAQTFGKKALEGNFGHLRPTRTPHNRLDSPWQGQWMLVSPKNKRIWWVQLELCPKRWMHLDFQPKLSVKRTWGPFRTLETDVHAYQPTRQSLAGPVDALQSKRQENPMCTAEVMPKKVDALGLQPRLSVKSTWGPFQILGIGAKGVSAVLCQALWKRSEVLLLLCLLLLI